MLISPPRRKRFASFTVLLGLVVVVLPARGQVSAERLTGPRFGIGYVADAPEEMAGGSTYVIVPWAGGIGLLVDAKFDIENPSDLRGYDPNVTADYVENIVGGRYIRREGSWWSLDAAVVRPLSPYLMVYVGGGMAHRTLFRLYQVDTGTGVGVGGVVWAEDPRAEETRVNLMTGLLLRLSPWITTHFGIETQPRGFTVGASLRFPAW